MYIGNKFFYQDKLFWIFLEFAILQILTHQKFIQKYKEMLDWEGLLKFSLKYSDGTKKSEFKQMKQQDKKFLQEVLDHYCNTEIKRLQQILEQLNQIQFSKEQDKIDLLEQLQELLDSLDKGGTLYKMNGHISLLRIIFYSQFNSNKILALQILSSANQNDASVQNESINSGALELLELIQKETDVKVRQNMMSTISSIIRGQNLQAKRIFIKINGLEVLKKFLSENPSQKLVIKINTLLRDLLYYDNYLHQTYKSLQKFGNTSGLKGKKDNHDLTYDVNEEKLKNNFLPENKKYQGVIKKFMDQNKNIASQYQKWLKEEQKNN